MVDIFLTSCIERRCSACCYSLIGDLTQKQAENFKKRDLRLTITQTGRTFFGSPKYQVDTREFGCPYDNNSQGCTLGNSDLLPKQCRRVEVNDFSCGAAMLCHNLITLDELSQFGRK